MGKFVICLFCTLAFYVKAAGQNPRISLLEIDAFVVSAYINTTDGGFCGGRHCFMLLDGMYYYFIKDTHYNKYVYTDSLCAEKKCVDVLEFDYDEIEARKNGDYTHNLYFGKFEFIPKGENVVRSRGGFYEIGDTLYAIYKYKGRVLEYVDISVDSLYRNGFDMDCPCDGYVYKPYNVSENKFVINYHADKLEALSSEELATLFDGVKWSAIEAVYLTLCE